MRAVLYGFSQLFAALLILAPALEKRWYEDWIVEIKAVPALFEKRVAVDAMLEHRAFPHYRSVRAARTALLGNSATHEIALKNEPLGERQRIAEILYPIRVNAEARFSLFLDMRTGAIAVERNAKVKQKHEARKADEEKKSD